MIRRLQFSILVKNDFFSITAFKVFLVETIVIKAWLCTYFNYGKLSNGNQEK